VESGCPSEGIGSAELTLWYNNYAKANNLETRSRASVINSLEEMVDLEILKFYEIAGQGGFRKLYYPAVSPLQFKHMITKIFTEKVKSLFYGSWWKPE
jgi:hypothetical protein